MVNGQWSTSNRLRLIATAITPQRECLQLALDELFSKRRDVVYKHLPVQMVELMLHDASQIALNPLIVGLELFVLPLYMDTCRTYDLLMNGW